MTHGHKHDRHMIHDEVKCFLRYLDGFTVWVWWTLSASSVGSHRSPPHRSPPNYIRDETCGCAPRHSAGRQCPIRLPDSDHKRSDFPAWLTSPQATTASLSFSQPEPGPGAKLPLDSGNGWFLFGASSTRRSRARPDCMPEARRCPRGGRWQRERRALWRGCSTAPPGPVSRRQPATQPAIFACSEQPCLDGSGLDAVRFRFFFFSRLEATGPSTPCPTCRSQSFLFV